MHTRLARVGLSQHLQNSITHILGVENSKVEQPPPNDGTPRRCQKCVIASYGKGHKSSKDSMAKVKSRCSKYQQPVCRKHPITVCESWTQTQDITFLNLLDTCFVSKWQFSCVMYLKDIIFERSLSILLFEKVTFFEKKCFFLACNTHFTSIFTPIAHYFNPRLQTMYWNISIFSVSKGVELCHIYLSNMGT